MKPIYRKLIWLAVILVIWIGGFWLMTKGSVFTDPNWRDHWKTHPLYAITATAIVQWLMFYWIL